MSGPVVNRRGVLLGLGAATLAACASREHASALAPVFLPGADELEAHSGGGVLCLYAERGDRAVAWRADQRATYCSSFKAFLAAAVLQRADRGLERLDRQIPITAADMIQHAPVTGPAVGSTLTVETLARATSELSDNPAANILIRELGGLDAWRAWWPTELSDRVTRVDRLEPEMNLPDPVKDTTTPRQTVENLQRVLAGDLLSPASRAKLESWMTTTPTGPGRIKAGAPADAVVVHKTGTWNGPEGSQTNDVGLIRLRTGAPVFLAIYHKTPPVTGLDVREGVIAEATRRALAALDG